MPDVLYEGDLASNDYQDSVVARFTAERSKYTRPARLEFKASKTGDLWVKWGRAWKLLTWKNDPKKFLSRPSNEKYGINLAQALGVSPQESVVSTAGKRGAIGADAQAREIAVLEAFLDDAAAGLIARDADIDEHIDSFINGSDTAAYTFGMQTTETLPTDLLPLRELQGLDEALNNIRGEKAVQESRRVALQQALEGFENILSGPQQLNKRTKLSAKFKKPKISSRRSKRASTSST